MRIKYTYTSKSRICFWLCSGTFFYVYGLGNYHVDRDWHRRNQMIMWCIDVDYDEWKKRERYRWSEYLRNWDPIVSGNTGRDNMGYLSSSVFDKWFWGNRKFLDPPPYTTEADQFIALADSVCF